MKKEVLQFKLDRPRTRAHRVLFTQDTPYKPKRVASDIVYKRKPKHQKKWTDV